MPGIFHIWTLIWVFGPWMRVQHCWKFILLPGKYTTFPTQHVVYIYTVTSSIMAPCRLYKINNYSTKLTRNSFLPIANVVCLYFLWKTKETKGLDRYAKIFFHQMTSFFIYVTNTWILILTTKHSYTLYTQNCRVYFFYKNVKYAKKWSFYNYRIYFSKLMN